MLSIIDIMFYDVQMCDLCQKAQNTMQNTWTCLFHCFSLNVLGYQSLQFYSLSDCIILYGNERKADDKKRNMSIFIQLIHGTFKTMLVKQTNKAFSFRGQNHWVFKWLDIKGTPYRFIMPSFKSPLKCRPMFTSKLYTMETDRMNKVKRTEAFHTNVLHR